MHAVKLMYKLGTVEINNKNSWLLADFEKYVYFFLYQIKNFHTLPKTSTLQMLCGKLKLLSSIFL